MFVVKVRNSDLSKLPLYCSPCSAPRGGYHSLGKRSEGQVPKCAVMEYGVKWWSMCAWRAEQMRGGDARRGTAQSQSHFWVEILSKQMLTGRQQVHSKVRRRKHSFWQLDIRQGCVPMKQGARQSAPPGKPNISPVLSYSSLWLHNLAVVLGLWTVNKPIC